MQSHRRSRAAIPRLLARLGALVGPILAAACAEGRSDAAPLATPDPAARCPEARAPAPSLAPAPAGSPAPEDVRRLHERLAVIDAIHEAAIVGDWYLVDRRAGQLGVEVPAPDEPERWRAPMERLHAELEAVTLTESPAVVAAGVARLAIVCGDCHRRAQASIVPPPTPPSTPVTDRDVVQAHRWAAQALWDALLDASDERWAQATAVFDAHLPGCTAAAMEASRVVAQQCHEADVVVGRGRDARTLEGRAVVYGQLLPLCASCHATPSRSPRSGS